MAAEATPEYAKLTLSSWTVGDIQTLFDVTDEEAEQFILNNQKHFQDRMTELSWDVLETLGRVDGLKLTDPDNQKDDDAENG